MKHRFPLGFFWGSATSSYQVEGGIENNDWAEAARQKRVPSAGRATDHYNRYEEDFDIARKLNQNAHRFSIEWARIEPEKGRFDEREVEHYRKVISALRERGIEPFVTLWHFTLPIWFSRLGGFKNKKAAFYFGRYCKYVVRRLDEVRFWVTINEPIVYVSNSFLRGSWPPFKKNPLAVIPVTRNLIKSHIQAYRVIKKLNPSARVGIAKNNIYFEKSAISRYFWNLYFLNKIRDYQDFIGLNFYFSHQKAGGKIGEEEKIFTDVGWEICPPGIYHVLLELKRYKKPIYITENGIADAKDEKRERFIKEHLHCIWQAIHDGIGVGGYFYWSLLDNFEREKGFYPRFGLVEIDYKTLERRIRASAFEYAKICKENVLEI